MSVTLTQPDLTRFWSKVDKTPTCWLWTGSKIRGYGQFYATGQRTKRLFPHRISYELLVGPIPEGLVIDHICRVPACLNPDHLRPVTNRENIILGIGPTAINARKTHCIRGHEFTPENTHVNPEGKRKCRACNRGYKRARDRRRRASEPTTPTAEAGE